jgi:hypothetical protein
MVAVVVRRECISYSYIKGRKKLVIVSRKYYARVYPFGCGQEHIFLPNF